MKTKSIHYAYPTSKVAVNYGYGNTGCYYLEIGVGKIKCVSPDKNIVLVESAQYNLPWCKYSMYNDVDGWRNE